MGFAWLTPSPLDGPRSWEVRANVFGTPPYGGPPDRDWDGLAHTHDGGLSYTFRSGADRVRELAQRFVEREASVAEVLASNSIEQYFQSQFEDHLDALEGEDEDMDLELEDFIAQQLPKLVNEPGLFENRDSEPAGYYHVENDAHMRDAAKALELPSWATLRSSMSGGPGSGYDAQIITLDEGRSLEELHAWLVKKCVPNEARRK